MNRPERGGSPRSISGTAAAATFQTPRRLTSSITSSSPSGASHIG